MENKGPFQEIEIRKPEIIGESIIVKKFSAMVADEKDQAVYNAIIDAAKKAGINSLLLMDRRFVLNALEVAIKRQEMLDSCSDAPSIEAEPVRHGRWIRDDLGRTFCFACEKLIPYVEEYDTDEDCGGTYEVEIDETPYCPNCGAKMDLEG